MQKLKSSVAVFGVSIAGVIALLALSGGFVWAARPWTIRALYRIVPAPLLAAARSGGGAPAPAPAPAVTPSYELLTPAPDEPFLHVVLASPEGALKVREQASEIRWLFDRPVTELSAIAQRQDPAKFVTITPPLKGDFRWASTRMLIFTPKQGLALSTRYTATLKNIQAIDGKKLKQSYVFSFDTPRQKCWIYGPDRSWLRAEDRSSQRAEDRGQILFQCDQGATGADLAAHLRVRVHSDNVDTAPFAASAADQARITASDPAGAKLFAERLATLAQPTHVLLESGMSFVRSATCPNESGLCHWIALNGSVPMDGAAEVIYQDGIRSAQGPLASENIAAGRIETPKSLLLGLPACKTDCNPEESVDFKLRGGETDYGSDYRRMFEEKITVRDLSRPGAPVIYRIPPKRTVHHKRRAADGQAVVTDEQNSEEDYTHKFQNPHSLRWADLKASHRYEVEFSPDLVTSYGHRLAYRSITTVSLGNYPAYARLRGGERVMERGLSAGLRMHLRNVAKIEQIRVGVSREKLVDTIHDFGEYEGDSKPDFSPLKKEPLPVALKLNEPQTAVLNLSGLPGFHGGGIWLLAARPAEYAPLSRYDENGKQQWQRRWRRSENGHDASTRSDDLRGEWTTALVQLTDLAVTVKESPGNVLISVTRLKTGQPVTGAAVNLYGDSHDARWTGKTDAQGFAWAPGQPRTPNCRRNCDLIAVVESGDDFAYSRSNWRDWRDHYGNGGEYDEGYSNDESPGENEHTKVSLFTDRGVYKLGEEVHFKGLVRALKPHAVALPELKQVTVKVTDPRDATVYESLIPVDAAGGFDGKFTVPADGAMGSYALRTSAGGFASALVTTYRRPEFKVDVASAKPEFIMGDAVEGTVSGRYLFGAPMSDRDISWELRAGWTDFNPASGHPELGVDEGYSWRFWCIRGEDCRRSWERNNAEATKWNGGTGALNSGGQWLARHATKADPKRHTAYRLQTEGTVTDVNRQEIANRTGALLHEGEFYTGVKLTDRFGVYGGVIRGTAAAVTPDGKWKTGAALTARLIRWDWGSATQKTGDESVRRVGGWMRVEVASTKLTSAAKPMAFELKPDKPGYYEVNVQSVDARGNWIEAGTDAYVTGPGYVPWRDDSEDDSIRLIPERDHYRPGETAKVLIESPWPEAEGLLTIERGEVMSATRFHLSGAATAISVPVLSQHTPNLFVSVTLFKGRTAPPDAKRPDDPGRPQVRSGITELKVPPAEKELRVSVTADREEYRPGDSSTASVLVRDFQGKPATGEVTLWAVDEGVLRLTGYHLPQLLSVFYQPRAHAVVTSDSRMRLIAMRDDEAKGGVVSGAVGGVLGGIAGGGGGLDDNGKPIRTDFRILALWQATVSLDANGRAAVPFKLPESLTSYRIMAVATSGEDRFGGGETAVRIKKPFMVLPALPRFLNIDDTVEAGAVLHNQTGKAARATLKLKLPEHSPVSIVGPAEKSLLLPPGPTEVRFTLRANSTGTVKLVLSGSLRAANGQEADAVTGVFSVTVTRRMETVAAAGMVDAAAGKPEVERLRLPGEVYPTLGGLDVELSSSALAGLQNGVDALVEYPYGCLEQRSSRLRVLMMLKDLQGTFPLPALSGKPIDGAVNEELAKIATFRTPEGGLAYWPGGAEPDLYLSARVLILLLDARDLGYKIPPGLVDPLAQFLQREVESLRDPKDADPLHRMAGQPGYHDNDWHWWGIYWNRGHLLYALARAGRPEPALNDYVWATRGDMDLLEQIHLLRAMLESGQTGEKPQRLLRELLNYLRIEANRAVVQNDPAFVRHGWCPCYAYLSADDTHNTAALLSLLLRINKKEPLAPLLARELLARRKDGVWENTLENGYALTALVEYYRVQEPDSPDFKAEVKLGILSAVQKEFRGRSLDTATAHRAMPDLAAVLAGGEQSAPLSFSAQGTGRLYYTARLKYAPLLRTLLPLDAGFTVERDYLPYPKDGKQGNARSEFTAGDLVVVRLKITTPQGRQNVVIDDPLPAGLEPLNAALATASHEHLIGGDASEQPQGADEYWRTGGIDHVELKDERVLLFATVLNPGTFNYTYVARATAPGRFLAPPTQAEEMYRPEIFGRSGTVEIRVLPPVAAAPPAAAEKPRPARR